MKHLLFVAFASSIFTVTGRVNAQSSEPAAPPALIGQMPVPVKFIEDIEIMPAASATAVVVVNETPAAPVAKPASAVAIKNFSTSIEACSALQFKYAMITDREVESISNFQLYEFIDRWWATRYHYGGVDSNGIDCSAFTGKLVAEVFGQSIPRVAKDQYKLCEKLDMSELAEGDLVFFNTTGGISHVGLYLGNKYFVHSSLHEGVTISNLDDDYYNRRFVSGGRIPAANTLTSLSR